MKEDCKCQEVVLVSVASPDYLSIGNEMYVEPIERG